MKKIEIVAEKTKTGFSGYAKKYPVVTTGQTFHQLKRNLVEAMNLYLEDSGARITDQNLIITLDIPQFFSYYKVINAKAFSEYIGMNQSLLAQYTHGIKIPSSNQTNRIIRGIRKLAKELSEIELTSNLNEQE